MGPLSCTIDMALSTLHDAMTELYASMECMEVVPWLELDHAVQVLLVHMT